MPKLLVDGLFRCMVRRLVASENVWSVALSQAKSESGRVGLRKCMRPLLERQLLARMECAAFFSPLVMQP
jgi:hypothetical protein